MSFTIKNDFILTPVEGKTRYFATEYENPLSETIKISQKYFAVAINKDYPSAELCTAMNSHSEELTKFNNFKGKIRLNAQKFYSRLMQIPQQIYFLGNLEEELRKFIQTTFILDCRSNKTRHLPLDPSANLQRNCAIAASCNV